MDKYVYWSILLMNMDVDPYQLICRIDTHTNNSRARNQIWTGDTRIFSPLLYQLSYPDHSRRTIRILIEDLVLCQWKRRKGDYKALSRSWWNFLDLQKEDFVSFSTVQVIICIVNHYDLQSGLRAQRCSFVRVSYISQGLWKEKKFRSDHLETKRVE